MRNGGPSGGAPIDPRRQRQVIQAPPWAAILSQQQAIILGQLTEIRRCLMGQGAMSGVLQQGRERLAALWREVAQEMPDDTVELVQSLAAAVDAGDVSVLDKSALVLVDTLIGAVKKLEAEVAKETADGTRQAPGV